MSSSRKHISNSLKWCAPIFMDVLLGLLLCLLINLSSCKAQERVQVIEVPKLVTQTNTEHHTTIVRDTVLRSDSVIIVQRGDTIIERSVTNVTNINRWYVADTIHDTISVKDTRVVEVPVEVTKEVKKPPNAIDTISIWLGRLLLAALLIWGGWKAIGLYRRHK